MLMSIPVYPVICIKPSRRRRLGAAIGGRSDDDVGLSMSRTTLTYRLGTDTVCPRSVRPIKDVSEDMRAIAAVIFAIAALGVVVFQLCLAAGAPWGAYAMGGRFPGRFPPSMRAAAVVQGLIIALMAAIVLATAGLAFETSALASSWTIWIVVAFSGVSLVMNSLSHSKGERRLWVPVGIIMLASSVIVALVG